MVWCYINKRIQSPKAVWYVAMIMSILKLIDKRIQSQKAVWYVAMIVSIVKLIDKRIQRQRQAGKSQFNCQINRADSAPTASW